MVAKTTKEKSNLKVNFHHHFCPLNSSFEFRDTMGGKTDKIFKTKLLPGFCGIEGASSSTDIPVMWPQMLQCCLPKIGCGGPAE
jgi:hypothetical protein